MSTPGKPEPLRRRRSPSSSRCGRGNQPRGQNFGAPGYRKHRNPGVFGVDAASAGFREVSTPAKPEPLCRHRSPLDSRCGRGNQPRGQDFGVPGYRKHRNPGVSDVDAASAGFREVSTPAKPEPLCRHRSPLDSRCGRGNQPRGQDFGVPGYRKHRNPGVSDVDAASARFRHLPNPNRYVDIEALWTVNADGVTSPAGKISAPSGTGIPALTRRGFRGGSDIRQTRTVMSTSKPFGQSMRTGKAPTAVKNWRPRRREHKNSGVDASFRGFRGDSDTRQTRTVMSTSKPFGQSMRTKKAPPQTQNWCPAPSRTPVFSFFVVGAGSRGRPDTARGQLSAKLLGSLGYVAETVSTTTLIGPSTRRSPSHVATRARKQCRCPNRWTTSRFPKSGR